VLRAFIILVALTAAVFALADSGAQAAGSSQSLGIVLHHNAAATERLPHYRATAPITINVGGYARRLASLTVTAHGPGGEAIMAPLARTGDTFSGALQLMEPGTWTVAFSTQLGSVTAALASVPLDVVSDEGADLAARIAFALSAISILAGLALVLRVGGRPLAFAVRIGSRETLR
jgi:hypothetical protein